MSDSDIEKGLVSKTAIVVAGIIVVALVGFLVYTQQKKDKTQDSLESASGNEQTDDGENTQTDQTGDVKVVMFHNGTGPMCIEALDYFDSIGQPVEEHLTTDSDFKEGLDEAKEEFEKSEGLSDSFGYYPMIFVGGRAFSGFDEDVKAEISGVLGK